MLRCVEVVLDQPTRDGQTVLRLLTNPTPEQATALPVAEIYLGRRTIETAFQELEAAWRSAVATLAYPRAALLAFCVALGVYNLLQVVRATVEQQRVRRQLQALSGTLRSQEVRSYLAGVSVALAGTVGLPGYDGDETAMRAWWEGMGERLDLRKYAKSRRNEKKPRAIPRQVRQDHHGATARILKGRKSPRSP